MAEVTVSSRPAAAALAAADVVLAVQGGVSVKASAEQIAAYVRTPGSYTPTVVNGANVAVGAASGNICRYIKSGTMLMLSGSVAVTPTSAGATTTVTIPLPVDAQPASNFAAGTDASGPVTGKAAGSPSYENGQINSTTGAKTLSLSFYPASGGVAYTMRFCIIVPLT
jgi:hypothetical protein